MRTLLVIAALLLAACGGRQQGPARPEVAPSTLAWIEKAEAEEKLRHHNRARLLYLRAKREAPDDPSRAHAAAAYAETLLSWGEVEQARRELQEAVGLFRHPRYYHLLGFANYNLGQLAAAEAAFRTSIEMAPRTFLPRRDLAALLVTQKRYAEAIAAYEQLLALEIEIPPKAREQIPVAIEMLRAELRASPGATD